MISITKAAMNCDQVYALVVGIETYEIGPDYDLDGPAQDGLNFIDWLLSQGVLPWNIRFFVSPLAKNVVVRSQAEKLGIKTSPATRDAIDGYIREELITEQSKGEGLYVFWGGHGILTKTHSTTRRLLFADTTAENKLNLDVNSLVQALSTSAHGTGYRQQIFLVDACANNYYQGLYEIAQSEVAGQRYSATGEQNPAEQFVMFAAADYGVAINGLGTGLFSSAVLAELQGQPLWPEMKALAERVKASFGEQNKPEPVYWWYQEDGCNTVVSRKSVQAGLGRAQKLEIGRLQTEIEDLAQDHKTVATQLRNELDGSTQNKLKRQLEQICLEMEKREKHLAQLRQSNG
jgi:hypothetical protein